MATIKEIKNKNWGCVQRSWSFNLILLLVIGSSSCKKYLDVPAPVTTLSSDNVYTNDASAAAVLTGIYTTMAGSTPTNGTTVNAIPLITGLSSDELVLFGGNGNANATLAQFYENKLSPGTTTSSMQSLWSINYSYIYICNIALARLQASNSLTPAVKQQLMGEARFLRAYFYFDLVNLYGDVPLATTSDVTTNSTLSRSSQNLVYQQIVSDLISAQNLLSDGYLAADAKSITAERVRPNKWVATALLARVYLYNKDWTDATVQATALINHSSEYSLVSLNDVFLKNSNETIWSLQPVNTGWNTEDARVFILPASGPTSNTAQGGYPVYLSQQLLSAFEQNDQRFTAWVGNVSVSGTTYYYPLKYKSATLNAPVTEYTVEFRLAEQFLIRAEAEANNGDPADGVNDLNVIRSRAGLPPYDAATDAASLIAAVQHERQVELFAEGHRWLDLKRTSTINSVMANVAPSKNTTWNSDAQLYPLPAYDIFEDPNLKQNPGY
ncbi:MAG: RagB/SusD family nutrient uptake outer membrane protein [Mucilaginibacter sp.]